MPLASGAVKYEIAFNGSPLVDPATFTWTDVSSYVMPGWTGGRGLERLLEDPRTGELSITIDNRTGRFDPGNATSPYAPNVREYRPIRITYLTGGALGVWYGYVQRWPSEWTDHRGRFGKGNLYCIDAVGFLNGVDGRRALDAEVLADSPLWYYRLDEDPDSDSAGDIVDPGHNPPLVRTDSKYGPGTVTFGTDMGIRGGGPGVNFDSPNAGTPYPTAMSVLKARPGKGGYTMAPTSGGFSMAVWVRTPTAKPNFLYVPWGQFSDDANSLVAFYIDSLGRPQAVTGSAPGVYAYSLSGPSICNGGLHMLFATISSDYKTVSLVVDGVDYGAALNLTGPVDLSNLTSMIVGGQLLGNGNSFNGMKGSVAAVAMWPGVLSASRAAAMWRAGLQAFSGEKNSDRITRILDNAGWPTALRDIQTSMGTAGPLAEEAVGQQLIDTADAEFGRLYVAGDGKVTFRSRADLYTRGTPALILGEDVTAGEIPYEPGPVVDYDPLSVVNVINGSRPNGARVTVADPARTYTRSADITLNVSNDATVVDALNYLLQQRSAPQQRLTQLRLRLITKDNATIRTLLQAMPGTRIRFTRRPPAVAGVTPPTVNVDCFLETTTHVTDLPNDWAIDCTFSPLPRLSYWKLEDATYGVLGSTTRLGF